MIFLRIKKMIKAVTARLVLAVKFLPREIRAAFLIMGVEAAGRSMLSPRRLARDHVIRLSGETIGLGLRQF